MEIIEPICDILSLRIERGLELSVEQSLHLSHSYHHKKYVFFRNARYSAIGYVIWANICEETYFRIANHGIYPIYPYEWNEGNICFILDVVFDKTGAYEAKKKFLDFIKEFEIVAFRKKSAPRIYIKINNKFIRDK